MSLVKIENSSKRTPAECPKCGGLLRPDTRTLYYCEKCEHTYEELAPDWFFNLFLFLSASLLLGVAATIMWRLFFE